MSIIQQSAGDAGIAGQCAELPCGRYERDDPTKTTEENAADYNMQMNNLSSGGRGKE